MLENITLSREDFINQFPPLNLLNKKDVETIWSESGIHLYIHIPYCIKKCDFCYYISTECREGKIPEDYLDALIEEMRIYQKRGYLQNRVVKSIYFGGGTPSLMSSAQIKKLCDAIAEVFNVSEGCEFCCEVRPGPETTKEKILLLKEYGANRISMGCQSLNDDVLRKNGRNHNAAYFYKVFDMLRECNVDSINVDIMSGMIGDSKEIFLDTTNKLLELSPENLTIYKMELYFNNKLYKKVLENGYVIMSDEEEAECVSLAYRTILDAGYSFADNYTFTKAKEFVQVQRYDNWFGEDMIGIGLSSHSYYKEHLFQNENGFEDYYKRIGQGELPIRRAYKMSAEERMRRWMIFALKKMDVLLDDFHILFGIDAYAVFNEELKELERGGYISFSGNRLLTTVKGALYADDIVRIFYPERYRTINLAHKKRN